jgi:hypothetical protein
MYVDFFNSKPEFYLNSKVTVKSSLGNLVVLISVSAILAHIIYLLVIFLKKEEVNVITNNISDVSHNLNIKSRHFMFSLTSALGIPVKSSIVNFAPQMWTFVPGINNGAPVISKIPYSRCDLDSHFGKYRNLFQNFTGLSNYFCLETNNLESDVFGYFGDLNKGFS